MIGKISLKKYESIDVTNEEMEYLEKNHIFRDENLKNWSLVIAP